jgi:site-specific DNA-methyltransferase (adenine-specific)
MDSRKPNIKIINSDCLKVMKQYPDGYFDLALCDPNYGIKESAHRNLSRSKLAKTGMYKKEFWDYDIPDQKYFNEVFRISKHQIIFGINYFLGKRDMPFSAGRIIWDKCNDQTCFSDCEIAYSSFHSSTRIFRFLWNGMLQGTDGNGKKQQGNKKLNQYRIHPTEKPIPLYKWILRNYAQPDWKIIDTHFGSGSSGIAAYDFGINEFVAIEIDKEYAEAALSRLKYYSLELKLFSPVAENIQKQLFAK